jgi:BirA family transcriptional regulator, biotin operon repressor / biotin---[acetyl-CoA-carboxylase] ligase
LTRLVALPTPVNVVWFDTVDSTNAVAERIVETWLAAEEDRLPETVVVARRQTSGRGRGGHSWESPAGGLYATWLTWLPLRSLPAVPMVVGVTLAEAVEDVAAGVRVGLKWPNDLQVEGRKLGGVLCTSRSDAQAAWVAAGFGINVSAMPALSPDAQPVPVSLQALGLRGAGEDAIWSILTRFLRHVHAAMDDLDGARARWAARSVHRVGERVRLRVDAGVVEGVLAGFGRDGELELEVAGKVQRFSSGELVVKEP